MGQQRDGFRDIDDRTEELRDLADDHPDIWRDFLKKFELSWVYHEHALEGVVLTHAEVTSALRGRPIAPDTYAGIRGLKCGMDLVRREAASGASVDLGLVQRIHSVLGTDPSQPLEARYRKEIPLHRTYFHDIAQPQHIASRLARVLDWAVANEPDDDDAVRFAAHLHHDFMSVFPFTENTGKAGRLLVNHVLLRHGYLPVVFHATERQRYYETLRLSRKDMEGLLLDMMGNCIENASTYIAQVLAEREKQQRSGLVALG